MIITCCELEPDWWFLLTDNGLMLGWIYTECDGYFVWQANPELSGFQEAHVLRFIADFLDELNEAWNKQVFEYFELQ